MKVGHIQVNLFQFGYILFAIYYGSIILLIYSYFPKLAYNEYYCSNKDCS